MSSMVPFEHMKTPVAGQFYHVYGFKVEANQAWVCELGNVGAVGGFSDHLCKSWCRNLELIKLSEIAGQIHHFSIEHRLHLRKV
jgi:hypothetical protein